MESLKGKWIEVQGYKHNQKMHRIWDAVFVVDENKDSIIVCSNRTRVIEHDFRLWHTKEPAVMIYFKDRWYNVIAMLKENGITYYVNLASPYVVDKGHVKYIDYDLDIKMYPDKKIKIIDVREYGMHKKKFGYGEDIEKILKFNVNEIKQLMADGKFPFDDKEIYRLYNEFSKEVETNKNER